MTKDELVERNNELMDQNDDLFDQLQFLQFIFVGFKEKHEKLAANERARIVAWLRKKNEHSLEHVELWGKTFAAAIEAGEHLK